LLGVRQPYFLMWEKGRQARQTTTGGSSSGFTIRLRRVEFVQRIAKSEFSVFRRTLHCLRCASIAGGGLNEAGQPFDSATNHRAHFQMIELQLDSLSLAPIVNQSLALADLVQNVDDTALVQ
jgi:hypothetical protein